MGYKGKETRLVEVWQEVQTWECDRCAKTESVPIPNPFYEPWTASQVLPPGWSWLDLWTPSKDNAGAQSRAVICNQCLEPVKFSLSADGQVTLEERSAGQEKTDDDA